MRTNYFDPIRLNDTRWRSGILAPTLRARLTFRASYITAVVLTSLAAVPVPAVTNQVTSLADSGSGSLRQAIVDASAGDVLMFGVTGTITLTNGGLVVDKDLSIVGPDAGALTLSGNNATRVFEVQSNVALTVARLSIANGRSTNGGGIYNIGGNVTLLDSTLRANVATNTLGEACGGAVFNAGGKLNATNCTFAENESCGGPGSPAAGPPVPANAVAGQRAMGGAVFSTGDFNASRCFFLQNKAQGGNGGAGLLYNYYGAPVYVYAGAAGGAAEGGAILSGLGMVMIERSILASNSASGGMGGAGATGGQAYDCGPYFPGTASGDGGTAKGAALCTAGDATLMNSTFADNIACGGRGSDGAAGGVIRCHGGGHTAGGAGGNGGNGLGAIYNDGRPLILLNCTLARNDGAGGLGGASGGDGYYTYYDPPDNPNPTTITWPAPPTGTNGVGVGGIERTASLFNTVLAFNHPLNGRNALADMGHNLSSDLSCAFTNIGSLNDTEPQFVGLAGGNLRLQTNSPCINGGANAYAPGSNDVDGRPRIIGGTVDMGAYEYQGPAMGEFIAWLQNYGLPTDGSADSSDSDADARTNWQEWRCGTCPTNPLSALRLISAMPYGNEVSVIWESAAGVSYFLERSTNCGLTTFVPLAADIPGQSGTTTFIDRDGPGTGPVFYRVGVRD